MNTVNIILHEDHTSRQDQLRAILSAGNITIDQLTTGNPFEITDSLHPCIHIVASPIGISIQEETQIMTTLSHRFVAAEIAITAQSIFSNVLVGMYKNNLHLFIPLNETIMGNLSFLLSQFSPKTTSSAPKEEEEDTPKNGINISQMPSTAPLIKPTPSGWREVIKTLGGTIDTETWADINLNKPAPVRNILEQAGTRALVRFENRPDYTLYGYPNFSASNAKVLLVGTQGGQLDIIALHRAPQKVGIVCAYGCDWLPKNSLSDLCKEITGRFPPKTDATVFAIDSRSMYYESAGTIYHWDGKRERNFGNPNQALSSLLLQWSQQ